MTLTNKLKQMRRREEGFTIVELLIVIIVIAILAALVIAAYVGIQQRARDSERQSDIRNIATAVQAAATIDDGRYPACTAIAAGTVENIEPDAIEPPNANETTPWVTNGEAGEAGQYGCYGNDSGVVLSYWLESPPSDSANPQTRSLGTPPAAPTP